MTSSIASARQKSILVIPIRSDYVHVSYTGINVIPDVNVQFVFLNVELVVLTWFGLEFEAEAGGSKGFRELLEEEILLSPGPLERQLVSPNSFS